MKVLIVGAGVVGTVYGAHLAAAGSTVEVLSHGPRTDEAAAGGLRARDVTGGGVADAKAAVVPDASGTYDLVLIAVRRDQLASACAGLTRLAGKPAILFLGNNPAGRAAIPGGMPGDVYLGFPGVGGVMTGGTAEYVRIRQQPTALQETADPRLTAFESAVTGRGFVVQRIPDMDGWLAYHAAFVACITAALYRCGTDPIRLAADRTTLALMCRAITEAFAALRAIDGCRPLLGTGHALAHGRVVLCRARAPCRGGDAGPGPRCGSHDSRFARPDGATRPTRSGSHQAGLSRPARRPRPGGHARPDGTWRGRPLVPSRETMPAWLRKSCRSFVSPAPPRRSPGMSAWVSPRNGSRFEPGMPAFVSIACSRSRLFLSEHQGDARPGTLIHLVIGDIALWESARSVTDKAGRSQKS